MKNRFIFLLLIVGILTTGCTSSASSEKDQETTELEENTSQEDPYPYIENQQYNSASVSDEDSIYVFLKNKLYSINKETRQSTLLFEGGNINGIGIYKDWLYCVENSNDASASYNRIIKLSKDGKEIVELFNNGLYVYSWVFADTLYTLNFLNHQLIEGYSLDKEGNSKAQLSSEDPNFLFKTYNAKQTEFANSEENNPGTISFVNKPFTADGFRLEAFNRITYGLDMVKENISESGSYWIIKNAENEEEIARLEVEFSNGITMNGEIAYINLHDNKYLKIVDFNGTEKTRIDISQYYTINIINYDKDWIYFWYNTPESGDKISRMNRTTYTIEDIQNGCGTFYNTFGDFFDVYEGLAVYTEYDTTTNKTRLAIMDLNSKEVEYIN